MEDSDGKRRAERELRERAEHRDTLDIKPLEPAAREDYAEQWRATQERFVDAPDAAVTEADRLVARVMQQRGYPVGDFDQMARDVSVDHSQVVQEYRAAREISERNDREQATTEELRQAMMQRAAGGILAIPLSVMIFTAFGALGGFLAMQLFWKDRLAS